VAYWTKGDSGSVVSWGSANFYSTLLAGISPARATVFVGADTPDVTAFQAFAATSIPGLKMCRATISAYAGSTPYLGNAGTLAYDMGGYALHVPGWQWTASTPAVHDITEFNPSVVWRSFMPDIFQAACSFTAGIDSATAVVLPPAPAASLPVLTLTYKTGGTLASSAIISSLNSTIAVRNKNVAAYNVKMTGTTTAAGGIFGTKTFGSTINTDPLWSAGGAAVGALVIQAYSGRTYTFADSMWTRIQLTCEVGAPVRVDIDVQGSGALTVA